MNGVGELDKFFYNAIPGTVFLLALLYIHYPFFFTNFQTIQSNDSTFLIFVLLFIGIFIGKIFHELGIWFRYEFKIDEKIFKQSDMNTKLKSCLIGLQNRGILEDLEFSERNFNLIINVADIYTRGTLHNTYLSYYANTHASLWLNLSVAAFCLIILTFLCVDPIIWAVQIILLLLFIQIFKVNRKRFFDTIMNSVSAAPRSNNKLSSLEKKSEKLKD